MKILDWITGKAASGKRTRLTSALLPSWSFNRELAQESDYNSLLRAYRSWIYVCSNKNATSVASIPLKLYVAVPEGQEGEESYRSTKPVSKMKKKWLLTNPVVANLPAVKKAQDIEEVTEHPWIDMMQQVNGFMNQFSLWELTDLYEELCGNSYWYIIEDNLKIPREIWPIPPNLMKIVPDPQKFIKGYQLEQGMSKEFFKEGEIIHFKFPNPRSPYYGMSPLSAVTSAYNLNEHMAVYEQSVFANMGRLEGAFTSDDAFTEGEWERVKSELKDLTRGAKNAGKSPFLPKGIGYTPFGYGPREISFIKGRQSVKEEICNSYGQSLAMYDEKANRANAEMAEYSFQKSAIKPRLMRIEQKINEKVMPRYDENLFAAFDDNVPEDRDAKVKERTEYVGAGIVAVNEIRTEDGLEPFEGFDEPWVATNIVPASTMAGMEMGGGLSPEDLEEVAETVAKAIGRKAKRYWH